MAIIECHECGKDISEFAKACPHCGAEKEKKSNTLVWILVAVFLILIVSVMNSGKPNSSASQPSDILSAARGACLIILKRSLHDPDSAEFGLTSEWYTERRKDGTILVQPIGRAKNALGAYIHGTWNCLAKPEGSNIRVLSLKQIRP